MYYCLLLKRNPGITVLESKELTCSLRFSVLLLHSKLPQIYWLRTIAIYYITSLWIRSLTWFFTQGLSGLNQSISQGCFSHLKLSSQTIGWITFHVVPTLQAAMTGQSFSCFKFLWLPLLILRDHVITLSPPRKSSIIFIS